MKKYNPTMDNYRAYQPQLLLEFPYSFEKDVKADDICHTILEVLEKVNIGKYVDLSRYDRRQYDPLMMLRLICIAYAIEGTVSLRKLEAMARYDLRMRSLCNGVVPSYKSFQRFINTYLKVSLEELNADIFKIIVDEEKLQEGILYIDGTKYEANANKMTFFWRGWYTKHGPKSWKRCMECIRQINNWFKENEIHIKYSQLRGIDISYLIDVDEKLSKWLKEKEAIEKGRGKHPIAKYRDELRKYAKDLFKYALAHDILGNRNSFSKTDPDATFMHMKYDYYNHTNVFKPGYNIQFGIVDNYIAVYHIDDKGNDVNSFEPTVEKYKEWYGEYPKATVADAGYGSVVNYMYCQEHAIEGIMKYPGYEAEKKKVNTKNQYRLMYMKRDERGTPICPQGHTFTEERTETTTIHNQNVTKVFYRNAHCMDCPFRYQCCQGKNGRTAQINQTLEKEKERIRDIIQSERGKELFDHRSSDTEGSFAQLKQNYGFNRLARRGQSAVEVEIGLVVLGQNLRRYHNRNVKNSQNLVN